MYIGFTCILLLDGLYFIKEKSAHYNIMILWANPNTVPVSGSSISRKLQMCRVTGTLVGGFHYTTKI